ncbi:MAG: VOC family protein [Eubacteriales bacterium]|nr:VOC family protein [Eubacteriales bacterium]
MVKILTHVAITTKNMEETLKFYKEVLGFEKVFELANPDTKEPWIVYVQVCAGQFLELFYGGSRNHTQAEGEIGVNHLCFEVDDVEKTAKHITDLGYQLDILPCVGCDNNLQTWVRDPNGIRIELMQVSPDSPHAAFM